MKELWSEELRYAARSKNMSVGNYVNEEATAFIKLLLELCDIYKVNENKTIFNCDKRYLATVNKNRSIQTIQIIQSNMPPGYTVLDLYKDGDGQDWLCTHVEMVCACLTKKIIWKIINGIINNDEKIKRLCNEDLLSCVPDAQVLNDIYYLPMNYFFSSEYDPQNFIASLTLELFSPVTRRLFNFFKADTWKILEVIFIQIFSIDNNKPFPIRHVGTMEYSKKLCAKLQVCIDLLEILNKWARQVLNHNLQTDILRKHYSYIEYYCRSYFWFSPLFHELSIILVDNRGNIFPNDSYTRFFDDITQVEVPQTSDRKIFTMSLPRLDSNAYLRPMINFWNQAIPPPNSNMPVCNSLIPQLFVNSCSLCKNEEKKQPVGDLKAYISEVMAKHSFSPERDYERELQNIAVSKIDLYLLMTLENERELQKWLPGKMINGCHFSYKGPVVNLAEHLHNRIPLLPNKPKYDYSNVPFPQDAPSYVSQFIKLFAEINGCCDKMLYLDYGLALNFLLEKFNIDENNLYDPVEVPKDSSWQISDDKNIFYKFPKNIQTISFNAPNGALLYALMRTETEGKVKLLPVTNWVKANENPVSFFLMPNEEKLPLLNLDYISRLSHASIIITDDIELAYTHGTECATEEGFIWTTWYGGEATIKRVKWDVLKGRKVYSLCKDTDSKKEISITLKLLKEFEKFSDTYLRIIAVENDGTVRDYKHKDFIELAKKKKIYIPEELKYKYEGEINTNITKKHQTEYIIKPVIETGTLTMIYAPAGTGKTWLALSIALAAANGKDVFSRWQNTKPVGVVYLAGEMKSESIEDRLLILNKIYDKSENEKLLAKLLKGVDLSTQEGQRIVDGIMKTFTVENDVKISLLIIDNLNTLAEKAASESGWQSLYDWLQSKKGLTTIIIHHPNKEGKYLGTSKIINKLDLMVYAGDKDHIKDKLAKILGNKKNKIEECLRSILSNDIAMFISPSKERLNEKMAPFWLSLLDLDTENPHWQVTDPNYDELLSEYGYSLDSFSKMLTDEYFNEFTPEKYKKNLDQFQASDEVSVPKKKDFLALPSEKQEEIIKELYRGGSNGKRSGKEIAGILDISPRKLNYIRKETKTQEKDLNKD